MCLQQSGCDVTTDGAALLSSGADEAAAAAAAVERRVVVERVDSSRGEPGQSVAAARALLAPALLFSYSGFDAVSAKMYL